MTSRLAPLHRLPRCRVGDRNKFIIEHCRDKRVLNLGCAAWPATAALLDQGGHVHAQIDGVSKELGGVDISAAGLKLLRQHGMTQLHEADLLDADQVADVLQKLPWTPQVFVAGELLVQLDAPGVLLRNIATHMNTEATLLITVPNALGLKLVLRSMLGYEKLNTGHLSYYSYHNVIGLLRRCGLEMMEVGYYVAHTRYSLETIFDWLALPLLWLRPSLADGLIVVCRRTMNSERDVIPCDDPRQSLVCSTA